ncbi:MAG: hypothetical protein Q9174_000824 [Haloplaca sp. 1 TL-2023]
MENHKDALASAPGPTAPQNPKRLACRYFHTAKGCRAGHGCRYLHDSLNPVEIRPKPSNPSNVVDLSSTPTTTSTVGENRSLSAVGTDENTRAQQHVRRYEPPPVDASRIVQKPIPRLQRESPREFQIRQLERRFAIQRRAGIRESILEFLLVPSDPDFPFEMPGLDCVLHVPTQYPTSARASLSVKNAYMPRGYQINVERGFDSLVSSSPRATLLSLVNTLDKQLEMLLTQEKAETIKLVPNAIRANGHRQEARASATSNTIAASKPDQPRTGASVHTPEQVRAAQTRRQAEISQLQARLGRSDVFSTNPDGITFTVPISPRRPGDLTVPLQAVRSVHLIVPLLYPLDSCRIGIHDVNRESAGKVERVFYSRAKAHPGMNLMAHINHLSQNMHEMAREPEEEAAVPPGDSILAVDTTSPTSHKPANQHRTKEDEDRSHIKIIPRPPEWTTAGEEESNTDSDGDFDFSDSYDSGDESDHTHDDNVGQPDSVAEPSSTQTAERGIALSFPSLELHKIELLELTSVSLSVKCSRCKTLNDISNLRPLDIRSDSCSKCTQPFSLAFRPEIMHINSFRAGYVDLTACTIADMLPSTFNPTCSTCSTRIPNPGVVSVRGDASSMAICRECHSHLSFKIPETKFMLISNTSLHPRHLLPLRRKKPKENLGIVAGQELPRRGRCRHYGKSYRWFRFSCCSKVYACDKCHDDAEGHPNEHANRMICGFCSREQNYRPEECGLCRMSVVGKKGTGFWEGGKGTRDKAKMSRKDPRKYKRRPGTRVGGAKKSGTGGGGEVAKKT